MSVKVAKHERIIPETYLKVVYMWIGWLHPFNPITPKVAKAKKFTKNSKFRFVKS